MQSWWCYSYLICFTFCVKLIQAWPSIQQKSDHSEDWSPTRHTINTRKHSECKSPPERSYVVIRRWQSLKSSSKKLAKSSLSQYDTKWKYIFEYGSRLTPKISSSVSWLKANSVLKLHENSLVTFSNYAERQTNCLTNKT